MYERNCCFVGTYPVSLNYRPLPRLLWVILTCKEPLERVNLSSMSLFQLEGSYIGVSNSMSKFHIREANTYRIVICASGRPTQVRGPAEKGIKASRDVRYCSELPSPESHLSGIKASGCGKKYRESRWRIQGGTVIAFPSGRNLKHTSEYDEIRRAGKTYIVTEPVCRSLPLEPFAGARWSPVGTTGNRRSVSFLVWLKRLGERQPMKKSWGTSHDSI